ncbi:hypothetical protein [Arenimonas composti]|uniref:Peptidase C-terminal archaeal/bacterial domain-containing protein n=1 Tax=Arenimonas composti TR7-09 = DSM 18010 TaxID=1121013 RepID=A0A091BL24_9GAMM|nr:hypothetical protein [Arenimonas composti]KFN51494.1 hypothetical protein P873_00105 [Arenimonas composti TR7-09 = DSM 18010]
MTILHRRALATSIAALLAASLPLTATAQNRGGERKLDLGSPAAGEITSADHLNLNDGSRSAAWTVSLNAGQAIAVEASAGFCGRLSLFADEGGRLAIRRPQENSSCREEDGRQVVARSLVAPRAGRYTIVFSGRGSSDYGPYTLAARAVTANTGPLAAGDDREGLLGSDSQTLRLKVVEAGRYRIDLMSGEFDPVLRLRGNGVALEDDDGGDGTDARINAWLQPGEYTLEVARIGDSDGLYRLRATHMPVNLPAGVELQNSGDIAAGNLVGLLQAGPAEYRLRIANRSQVSFDLQSDEFDPRIDVNGPGTLLGDDDSGEGVQAKLVIALDPGDYTVRIADAVGGAGGVFRLRTAIAPAAPAQALTVGSPRNARLASGELARYPLTVSRAGRYVIRMESNEFDSVVHLLRDGEHVQSDDDSGGGNNARLEVDLQPGRYEVVAAGFDGGSGAYQLILEN